MAIMFLCCMIASAVPEIVLTIIAMCGGVVVSFAIGAFFSVTYTVPTHLAQKEYEETGKNVATMLFAVQGVFEGVASGIATGIILVTLKDLNVIYLLPIIVIIACMTAFGMSFAFPKVISTMGLKQELESK